jgi:hypothetical protein
VLLPVMALDLSVDNTKPEVAIDRSTGRWPV